MVIVSEMKEMDDVSEGFGGFLGDYGFDLDDDIVDS